MCVNGLLLLSVYFLFKISEHIVIEKIRNGYLESVAELFKVTIPIFLDFILIISFTVDWVTAERVASLFTVMFLSLHSCNMRLETASETDLHTIIIIPFSNDDTTNFR